MLLKIVYLLFQVLKKQQRNVSCQMCGVMHNVTVLVLVQPRNRLSVWGMFSVLSVKACS